MIGRQGEFEIGSRVHSWHQQLTDFYRNILDQYECLYIVHYEQILH